MKHTILLNEEQIQHLIKESIKRIMLENSEDDSCIDYWSQAVDRNEMRERLPKGWVVTTDESGEKIYQDEDGFEYYRDEYGHFRPIESLN